MTTQNTVSVGAIIGSGAISCLFQPIMNGRTRRTLGYEVLTRGPSGSPLHSPMALFSAADKAGSTALLDALVFERACERRQVLGLPGKLFINMTPPGLLAFGEHPERVAEVLERWSIPSNDIVFELTEQAIVDDLPTLQSAIKALNALGTSFAIDDLGSGHSGLKTWSQLAPEFVKIDRYFTSDVHNDPVKTEFVRAIVDMARAARSMVIAEGVETAEEAGEMLECGVGFLQGYHLARPSAEPAISDFSAVSIPTLNLSGSAGGAPTAKVLIFEREPITPEMAVANVAELFHRELELDALPVVRDSKPLGLVRRSAFLDLLSIPLRRELYAKRPIESLMETSALVVEEDLRLEQVSRLVTSSSRTRLAEQFIVARHGDYVGMARVSDLLRAITAEQIQVARYSNPLTLLPGNVPIYDWINRAVARERHFVLCHVDVDNFKPFNDYYGYAKGDEALIMIANVLTRCASPKLDFVGHVGGDDFVFVFQTKDWRERIDQCFAEIAELRKELYSAEDLQRGCIVTNDRYGAERSFPLLSISVAALACSDPPAAAAEELIRQLAPIKERAKRQVGNALELGHCAGGCNAADGTTVDTVAAGNASHRG
ncbi:MAG: bifunctional diguanylate cyclase/phosphodiesterase [Pseudomonadota bacterium]